MATCFGADEAEPQFVALAHQDPGYVYFFGELLLCFVFEHEGVVHKCIFVEYLWPDELQYNSREDDGIPLHTRYRRTPRKLYTVANACVRDVLFRPQLSCIDAAAAARARTWVPALLGPQRRRSGQLLAPPCSMNPIIER